MSANRLKWLRVTVITLLIVLVAQFEFGMAVNLSDLPSLSPFGFSVPAVLGALQQAGVAAVIHAGMGTLLMVIDLAGLVMALQSRIRPVQIFGGLGFLSVVLAGFNGVLFTLSGFQDDHFSHGMASMFIVTFACHFLELYFLKPAPRAQAGAKS